MVHPHTLTDRARDELLDRLNLPELAPEAKREKLSPVEYILGEYPAFTDNVDNAPRPADYHRALKGIARDAFLLVNQICNAGGYVRDALKAAELDVHATETAIANLSDAARVAADGYAKQESRGRTPRAALTRVVAGLCEWYAAQSKVQKQRRNAFGNQAALSEWESNRLEFVQIAIQDAKIPHPRELQATVRAALKLIDGAQK